VNQRQSKTKSKQKKNMMYCKVIRPNESAHAIPEYRLYPKNPTPTPKRHIHRYTGVVIKGRDNTILKPLTGKSPLKGKIHNLVVIFHRNGEIPQNAIILELHKRYWTKYGRFVTVPREYFTDLYDYSRIGHQITAEELTLKKKEMN